MEFTVSALGPEPDLDTIGQALHAVDAAASVDLHDGRLRVAGAFDTPTLIAALREAGYVVAPEQVALLPSVCCGSCSG